MSVIGKNQLKPPTRPKVSDPETERSLRELADKIIELQQVIRKAGL